MNPSAKSGRGKPTTAKKNKRKSREELNIEGRERQRQKKRRGLASGSRAQEGNKDAGRTAAGASTDRRIGSKKPVPLIASAATVKKPAEPDYIIPATTISPQMELDQLENDDRLDDLLQRLERDEELAPAEQAYVDRKLDRIDELMTLLGIELDEEGDEEEEEKKEDMLQLLKRGHQKDNF
ncbi:Der GTPase-activating protein YihI [Sodalis sp. RH21]|uniref:Der GTPase-activating protein YihI n=1 Tax=unclassified Sodalis (in: enterobacteria) TaxID=2636512 RepID=UPI0039B6D572